MGRTHLNLLAVAFAACALPVASAGAMPAPRAGRLFSGSLQRAQRRMRPGNSEPRGPGIHRAGLALFRYRTRCGVVFGHTGNTPGYTQFIGASGDGRRSATVAINQQITATNGEPAAFARLRRTFAAVVCAALATRRP